MVCKQEEDPEEAQKDQEEKAREGEMEGSYLLLEWREETSKKSNRNH